MKLYSIVSISICSLFFIVQGQEPFRTVERTFSRDNWIFRQAPAAQKQQKTTHRIHEAAIIFTVTNTNDGGAGSLRQALLDANASAGLDRIEFDIPGDGFHWILLLSDLPQISDSVVIDGTSQPGYTGNLLIGLDGTGAGTDAIGLNITAGNSRVTGLAIQNFAGHGIRLEQNGSNLLSYNYIAGNGGAGILLMAMSNTVSYNTIGNNSGDGVVISDGATGNLLDNNYIGTDGASAIGNGGNGMLVASAGNIISNNLISGNTMNGVHITGQSAKGNLLAANAIGTNGIYDTSIANGMNGVLIESADNIVGGSDAAANLTSGNGENGIKITGSNASGNLLQGNFVGTDATGTLEVGNTANGIEILDADNTIIRRNLVSGNGTGPDGAKKKYSPSDINQPADNGFLYHGIYIQNATGVEMKDLFIGVTVGGGSILGNYGCGLAMEDCQNIVIGGPDNERVFVGGNAASGVYLQNVSDADIRVNIGTGFEGENIANVGTGMDIAGGENIHVFDSNISNNGGGAIFTTAPVTVNGCYFNNNTSPAIILNSDNSQITDNYFSNGENAIVVESGTGNEILGNRFSDVIFPLDLGGDGVTPNDPNDADTGPNNLQNTPTNINSFIENGQLKLSGDIDTPNPENAVIEVLYTTSLTEMNFNPIGTVMPEANGNWSFTVPADVETGAYFRAFSTTDDGTSESSPLKIRSQFFSTANNTNAANNLHPISMMTGELYSEKNPDLFLPGPMPLFFSRYYASMLRRDGIVSGGLGTNWLHNFDWKLSELDNTILIQNPMGRVIQFLHSGSIWQLQGKTNIPFQLVESNDEFVLADPRDHYLYVFDPYGKLSQIKDGKGNVHSLTYSGETLTMVSSNLGSTLSFEYDSVARLTSVTDGSRTTEFSHRNGHLTSSTDAGGNRTTYRYDTTHAISGLMTSEIEPNGNFIIAQTYDSLGRVVSQTDGNGNVHTIEYQTSSDASRKRAARNQLADSTLTVLTDPLGLTREFIHNQYGENTSFKDKAGLNSHYEYEGGNLTEIIDRMGTSTIYQYHPPSGKISAVQNPDGTSIHFTYTAISIEGVYLFKLSSIAYPDGTSEDFSHDAGGNLTSYSDRGNHVWSFTYNDHGQVLTATNPEGGVTTTTYNENGLPVAVENAAGHTQKYTYDELHRPITVTNGDNSSSSITWNNRSLITSRTDGKGNTTLLDYDANGNFVGKTDRLGNQWIIDFDEMNQIIGVTDPQGQSIEFAYDEMNRLKSVTDRNSITTTWSYDAVGRLKSVTDPLGNTFQAEFNPEGIIQSITDPMGHVSTITSDEMGRITSVADPLGNSTAFSRDVMGRITQITDPLNQSTQIQYNDLGLPTSIRLASGASSQIQRNGLGQIIQTTDPKGDTRTISRDAMGLVTSYSDPLENMAQFSFDNRSRPAQITLPGGLGMASLGYDNNNNLTSVEYSDGLSLNYQYDKLNRLINAGSMDFKFDNRGNLVQNNGLVAAYDAAGRMTEVEVSPGKTVTYEYDDSDQLTKVTDWMGGETDFAYDAAGRLLEIVRPNGVKTAYTYDAVSQLTAIVEIKDGDETLASIDLTRDANGQMISSSKNVPVQPEPKVESLSYQFDAASQISDYTYDALGRLIAGHQSDYTWDPASRLTGFTQEEEVTQMTYDALGNRTSRSAGGTTRTYRWNYAFDMPSVSAIKENSSHLRYYVHTPGGLLLYSIETSDSSRRFFHFDTMGNTLFITDGDARVIAGYAYTPFGKLLAQTGDIENPFTFQGLFGVMQEKGDLYYMRARYYDATSGRFLSRDPIRSADPRSINPYQYAAANPYRYIDPRGLQVEFSGYIRTRYIIGQSKLDGDFDAAIRDEINRVLDFPLISGDDLKSSIYDPTNFTLSQNRSDSDLGDIWDVSTPHDRNPHSNAFLYLGNGLGSRLSGSDNKKGSAFFGRGTPASSVKPGNFISKRKLIQKQDLRISENHGIGIDWPDSVKGPYYWPDKEGFRLFLNPMQKKNSDNKPNTSIMTESDPILKIL